MQKSEHMGLNIFEQADKMRMGAFNDNWRLLDDLLRVSGDDIAGRAKFASGSYEGQKANREDKYGDSQGKYHYTSFGFPVSSAEDKVIAQLDFNPQILVVGGSRTADYSWRAWIEDSNGSGYRSKAGKERQSVLMLAGAGFEFCPCFFSQRGPAIVSVQGYDYVTTNIQEKAKWPERINMGNYNSDSDTWGDCVMQMAVTESDGVFTVTAKGGSITLGTENLADIQGMTYHWVALG